MKFIHKGKEIGTAGLIGFGRSMQGVYEYIRKNYPDVKITLRAERAEADIPSFDKLMYGERQYDDICEDVIFISPGVRRERRELSGHLLSSDAELFFEKNTKPVFAVTGTSGKSTVAALTAGLLAPSFDTRHTVGNIGEAMSPHINDMYGCAYAVELSSFQLMYMTPHVRRAAITNITPSHLNWHSSLSEYISAKANILKLADEAVFSADSELLRPLVKKRPYAVFSTRVGEYELARMGAELSLYIKDEHICLSGKRLLALSSLMRKEEYSIQDLMAAIALTYGYSSDSVISAVAGEFRGLMHRFEPIYSKSGILCYNSSIDSSPTRTLATLEGYGLPYILILGGRSKDHNYAILNKTLRKNAHGVVLTGENRYEIAERLSFPVHMEKDFTRAVKLALSLASSECALIFSPASVSFDRFASFEERGLEFKRIIKEN